MLRRTARSPKCPGTPLRLAGYAMRLPSGGRLLGRHLEVGEELAALADEMQTPAEQVPGCPHASGVGIRLREHPPRSRVAISSASIRSFLALPPWMAFM